ncbi:hypothetical protein DS402_26960 [Escherichia coli]|nr:hypothetical protein [Escherichia coli]
MLFLYYAVERKVVSKGLRSREMAAAGNFGGTGKKASALTAVITRVAN